VSGGVEEGLERWSVVAQVGRCSGGEGAEEEEGSLQGGAPFIAGGGGWQRRHELQPRRWRQ
jgi:hypothetical protein